MSLVDALVPDKALDDIRGHPQLERLGDKPDTQSMPLSPALNIAHLHVTIQPLLRWIIGEHGLSLALASPSPQYQRDGLRQRDLVPALGLVLSDDHLTSNQIDIVPALISPLSPSHASPVEESIEDRPGVGVVSDTPVGMF